MTIPLLSVSSTTLGHYLELFANTEIFIFVFMEITSRIGVIQNILFKQATLKNYAVFIVLFGLFSIFGTYIGNTENSGAITNIRDLAPIVAGLVAGPVVGVSVGLIGGIHRYFVGGVTCVPCSMATVLAGLLAGLIFRANKGKLIGAVPAMLFGVAVELMHGGLALLIVRPFSEAVDIVVTSIPPMIVAVSLGLGVSMVILHSVKEPTYVPQEKTPQQTQKEQKPPAWTVNFGGAGWARFTGWLNKFKNRADKPSRGQ
jgi:sigma-B regulation protein RsbU (phosphoserine phosphatase)